MLEVAFSNFAKHRGETIKPKSGKHLLKWSYQHGYPGYNMFWEAHSGWGWGLANWLPHIWEIGGKWLRTPTRPLVIGKTYSFSLWSRGKDIKLNWFLGLIGVAYLDDFRLEGPR